MVHMGEHFLSIYLAETKYAHCFVCVTLSLRYTLLFFYLNVTLPMGALVSPVVYWLELNVSESAELYGMHIII